MSQARKRFNRFVPKEDVEWLDRDQRAKHRQTIKILTDLAIALEKGDTLSPAQEGLIRSATGGSDARDTRLNAAWDMLESTEFAYAEKLSKMAPHDLSAYHELINPHEPPATHHYFMCDQLMKVESGEISTLLLTQSPGSAKSAYSSRSFVQWYMGRNPDKRVLACSHTQRFGEDEFSKPNRSVLDSDAFKLAFPDVMLNPAEKGSSFWRLDGWRGSYAMRGVGAGTAGLRANLVMADDLYRNAQDALSPTIRETAWRWWNADVMSRRLPSAPTVLVNCLTGDTPVTLADGSWKPIRDIQVGDRVLTHKNGEHSIQTVERWAEQPIDEIIEVHCGNGSVKCNARHPFWAKPLLRKQKWGEPQWISAGDLKLGDRVLVSSRRETSTPARLSTDEAWLIGLMLGDGFISRSVVGKNRNREQLYTRIAVSPRIEDHERVQEIFRKVFNIELSPVLIQGTVRLFATSAARVGRWLHEHGITIAGSARTKRILPWIFDQPEEIRRALFDGFMFADGHINSRHGSITLCNKALTQDIRALGQSLGYRMTTVRTYRQTSTLPGRSEKFTSTRHRVTFSVNVKSEESFYFKGVTKLEAKSPEKVYDIQVSETHNFIADGIVVSNTLWHSEDVASRIRTLAEKNPAAVAQPFVFINIPVIAEKDDPIGRAEGEWLWCKDQQEDGFYSIQDYITKRDSMPPSMWSALYLGQPLDKQGDFIAEDEFQRYERPPINRRNAQIEWTKTVMSIDTAAKGSERSDYTAILTFRVGTDGRHYLVDVWRGKESMEKVIRVMSRLMRLWQVNYAIIEDTGMGVQILENYQGKLPSPLVKYTPSGKGSKDFRFDAAAPWITAGKVLFPTTSPWIHDFINELVAFPNGSNDDQVDAFAQYTDTEFKLRSGGTKPLRMRG